MPVLACYIYILGGTAVLWCIAIYMRRAAVLDRDIRLSRNFCRSVTAILLFEVILMGLIVVIGWMLPGV